MRCRTMAAVGQERRGEPFPTISAVAVAQAPKLAVLVVAAISLMSSCDKVRWEAKEKTVQACLASDRTAEACARVR